MIESAYISQIARRCGVESARLIAVSMSEQAMSTLMSSSFGRESREAMVWAVRCCTNLGPSLCASKLDLGL